MLANQELRKTQLLAARKEAQVIDAIRAALITLDPHARLLSLEKALVSRTVIKKLWELLPDEHLSYHYGSIEELKNNGRQFLSDDFQAPIVLHLGWDILAFATTLEAAWETVTGYGEVNTDTYNTCLYPASLNWYVIRAGRNLYPMDCLSKESPTLMTLEKTLPSR